MGDDERALSLTRVFYLYISHCFLTLLPVTRCASVSVMASRWWGQQIGFTAEANGCRRDDTMKARMNHAVT
jgi:hypothetical protein